MTETKAVLWDVDKVWYPDTSTNYAAMAIKACPYTHIDEGLEQGWFLQSNVDAWRQYRISKGKDPIFSSVFNVAEMYTDFFKEPDSTGEGRTIFTKAQIIERKQRMLKGLTMSDLRSAAQDVIFPNLTPGLKEAVADFRENGIYQSAFSDGMGPIIYFLSSMPELRVDHVYATPAVVNTNGREAVFEPEWIGHDNIVLTGKTTTAPNKNPLAISHLSEKYHLENVAAIDDSAANIEEQLSVIQQAGGIAIGFYPVKAEYSKFEAAEVPILYKGSPSLHAFVEIIHDRRKINEHCNTWDRKF